MGIDIRSNAAKYYDLNPNFPIDIPFYESHILSDNINLLELGCGTGRVAISLSKKCKHIRGIDLSESMIDICRRKLKNEKIPASNLMVSVGDITSFDLGKKFDLIIAPFRVFQNLETDKEVGGFFECVREHLTPQGYCILNVFNPNKAREALIREWCSKKENLNWEILTNGMRITCHDIRPSIDKEKLILYPELIYRKFDKNKLVDKVTLKLIMRCYYPDELLDLITSHGFNISDKWGGYSNEKYGEGPELIIKFSI